MSKSHPHTGVSRRALAPLGMGTLAAAWTGGALAAESVGAANENEAAREKLVTDFCLNWATKDVETLIPALSDTIEDHIWEGGPVINGVETFRKQMGPFMAGMREIDWQILRSTVMGDIVLNERIDYFYRPEGQKDDVFHVVGVFLVRDGKIQYWKDYSLSDDPNDAGE